MSLAAPDLRGWLPPAALARRLGVSPSTVRRRGSRGLLESIPNPLGPGALYRASERNPAHAMGSPTAGRTNRENLGSGAMRSLRRLDRLALAQLPASTTELARAVGLSKGSAARCLERLERAGFAERSDERCRGPRGGRPEIVWRGIVG
jgi:hypothetical protein